MECWSTALQWLCEVAGYWQELEHAVVYADPEHPKHAQWVICPVSHICFFEQGDLAGTAGFQLFMIIETPRGEILHGAPDRGRLTVIVFLPFANNCTNCCHLLTKLRGDGLVAHSSLV